MDNNLNFDTENYFGLGISATKIVLDNTGASPVLYRVFDASGLNTALNVNPSAQKPTSAEFSESTINNPDALSKSTIQYPIRVKKMLYTASGLYTAVYDQLNQLTFEWTRANIDGTVRRGADIQTGLDQRNWMYTNTTSDNPLVVIDGEFTIDQNTAMWLQVGARVKAEVLLVLDTSSYSCPDEYEITPSEYNGLIRPYGKI